MPSEPNHDRDGFDRSWPAGAQPINRPPLPAAGLVWTSGARQRFAGVRRLAWRGRFEKLGAEAIPSVAAHTFSHEIAALRRSGAIADPGGH